MNPSNHLKTADGTGTDTSADTGKKEVSCPGTDRQIPPTGKKRTRYTSPRCWTRYWRYAAIPTGTGCWRSSSTDRKNTVIHTLIHTIMFFTAINQMMTEGVDLTLVIRKANGQLAVSTLPKSNGLKDEAQNHIVPLTVNGKPEELDAGFLQTVARPIQKAVGLITNMAQFEVQAEKAASESKAAKDAKAKETKEEKERREKYEKHLKKAEELIAAKNHKDAVTALSPGTPPCQAAGPEED